MESNTLTIGEIYTVTHARKGRFRMLIEREDKEWVTGLITDGCANAILDYNKREQFDSITVRKEFCSFNK